MCCHAFRIHQCCIATMLMNSSSQACIATYFGIPETLLLTPHSFLAYDRTVPNPLSCIATFLTNFSSPFRIATKREFLNCYFTNTSFVSCIRSLFDWFYPAPVISNMAFYYQPNCRSFISDFNIFIFSSKFVFRPVD